MQLRPATRGHTPAVLSAYFAFEVPPNAMLELARETRYVQRA